MEEEEGEWMILFFENFVHVNDVGFGVIFKK
jgi:hypothetical protein